MERGGFVRSVLARSVAVIATSLTCWCATSSALAAGPGLVTIRVEGSNQTLLPATPVTIQTAAFHPSTDPVAAHTCSGASAARALETATAGTWGGTYFTSFGDYEVNSILGELHPVSPADGSYWAFWVNNTAASVGICQQQLSPGDQILFFPDCFGTGCPAGFVSPAVLSLSAPAVVSSGTPFTAAVSSYPNAGGPPKALVGASITGDGASAATGAGGQATLTLSRPGSYLLTATAANSVRTESAICVHNGNDGNCGTSTSPSAAGSTGAAAGAKPTGVGTAGAVPCATNGADGLCGTRDTTPPIARLQIAEGRHYRHGRGPRVLNGSVRADPSGIGTIRLRLTRQSHGTCQVYSPGRAALVSGACAIAKAAWFTVGPPTPFSYLLKKPLPSGRYVLDIEAIDKAGNVETVQVPGRTRIVFRVE
jgi:hypothetical protein